MATLINNAGVQHYANKMVLAENRKVGSKSLPTALNDIDNLIDEMKTHFDAEYGSALDMKLDNNENTFSVGTGTDIDKRDEVENGFTDVELSGNSLVNCVLIDKLYEDSNYLEFENSPVITEGNITLKSRQLNYVRFCPKIECGVIKPNTKYTLIFNVTSNNLTGRTNLTHTNIDTLISAFPFMNTIQPKQTGIFKYVLTSIADISSCNTLLRTIIWNDCSTEGETITFSLMILEGDWTNKPIPQYFEGLKSIGEKEDGNHKISILSENNGNIIVNPIYKKGYYVKHSNGAEIEHSNYSCTDFIEIEPRKKIRVIGTNRNIAFYNKNKINIPVFLEEMSGSDIDFTITTPNNTAYVRFTIDNKVLGSEACYYGENIGNQTEKIALDKKEISLNEPLRGLPNGVKDTIEKVNGEWKIVRRCGETILNGNENWSLWSIYGSNIRDDRDVSGFGVKLPLAVSTASTKVICDNFATGGTVFNLDDDSKTNHTYYTKSRELIYCYYANAGTTQMLGISIKNSKLGLDSSNWNTTIALANFKNWLSQNPTKVIYQLDTPIIEDISPVTLQCWKNGTISIDEVLPVESTHTVALNKPAQIQRNIEELTTLRKRVKKLEEMYDDIALEQAYKLSLINFNFELDYN